MFLYVQKKYLKNKKKKIMKIKCVADAYNQLHASLGIEKLEESKKCLVSELAKQASFLVVELDILKEQIETYGAIQINKNGKQKQTEASKHYNRTVMTFTSIMKNIHSIMGKRDDDSNDELERFLKEL